MKISIAQIFWSIILLIIIVVLLFYYTNIIIPFLMYSLLGVAFIWTMPIPFDYKDRRLKMTRYHPFILIWDNIIKPFNKFLNNLSH